MRLHRSFEACQYSNSSTNEGTLTISSDTVIENGNSWPERLSALMVIRAKFEQDGYTNLGLFT